MEQGALGRGDYESISEATTSSSLHADGEPCSRSVKDCLNRISPRATQNKPNFQGVAGGQRSRKRKSPCVTMPIFRSPLSRMLLSLRTPTKKTAKVEVKNQCLISI